MQRMTQILIVGLSLSISSIALAGGGNHRNHHEGHHGGHYHNAHHYDRQHGHRHHAKHKGHAPRHSHHGRYCNDWHPHGYAAPRVHYAYSSRGVLVVYQPDTGLYIEGGY